MDVRAARTGRFAKISFRSIRIVRAKHIPKALERAAICVNRLELVDRYLSVDHRFRIEPWDRRGADVIDSLCNAAEGGSQWPGKLREHVRPGGIIGDDFDLVRHE